MNKNIKIAVLGGGGRTGKFLVSQLLNQGYSLKLLLRNPEDFTIENPLIQIVKGDAVDAGIINLLVNDCQVIISTVGQRKDEPLVASKATSNILNAMAVFGIKRYILLAGLNVDTPFDKKSVKTTMGTEWMKANFPITHSDRQKSYSILAASELDWTLIRVPLIEFSDLKYEIGVSLEDCIGDKISAVDIAYFLVNQIIDVQYYRKAPFIYHI